MREAFTANHNTAPDIRPFTPQLTLQLGTRISQVVFSSDESILVASAEMGGGLAVYEVQSLLQGNTQSAFEMATNGVSVRSLVPNPAPATAEAFAIVTAKGDLMIANMKTKEYVAGQNGPLLKDGVSCLSWSSKGKQLVAGLGNGTCLQMTPDGQKKAEIPRPPRLEGDQHGRLIFTFVHISANLSKFRQYFGLKMISSSWHTLRLLLLTAWLHLRPITLSLEKQAMPGSYSKNSRKSAAHLG